MCKRRHKSFAVSRYVVHKPPSAIQIYRPQDGSDMSGLNTCTDLKEETYNFYGGVEKSFNDKLSLSLSVAGEYYKLMNYKKWAVYPAMQLSYALSDKIGRAHV